MVRFSFCGQELAALPQGALFWPARRALLLADLHLEKASWFAKGGQMLPPYDSLATLSDVAALAAAFAAEEIWCLGDSFHDRHGCDRLPERARAMLLALTATTRWTWIVGNHDPGFADQCGGALVDEAEVDGLVLRHEAEPGETAARAVRPFPSQAAHPPSRPAGLAPLLRRDRERKLILPAFGSLTGGLDAHHPEIVRALGAPAEALVPVQDKLLRFPIAA